MSLWLHFVEKLLDAQDCSYVFDMKIPAVCTPVSEPMSGAAIFFIIVLVLFVAYFCIGFAYRRFVMEKRGLDQIPNRLFWIKCGNSVAMSPQVGRCFILFAALRWAFASPGPQLWEVPTGQDDATIGQLAQNGLVDLWSSDAHAVKFLVERKDAPRVRRALREASLAHSVALEDVFAVVEAERRTMRSRKKRSVARRGEMDWTSYHDLSDIEGYIDWVNATSNGLVQVIKAATTDEGRPVYIVRVADRSAHGPKKTIWIEGGIHAREWISPAVTTYILHQVAQNRAWHELLRGTQWFFVPVANPDGYAYSFTSPRARLWRKNRHRNVLGALSSDCNGVDLNRNWDVKWGVGASSSPCSSTYMGAAPFSEAETRGIMNVMRNVGQIDLFITFHSYGQTVLHPYGWTKDPPPNLDALVQMAKRYSEVVKYHSKGQIIYQVGGSGPLYGFASGATDDWAYQVLRAPYSYTIELRDKGTHGFLLPESDISSTVMESASGVYCMASYLSGIGQCARRTERLVDRVSPRHA